MDYRELLKKYMRDVIYAEGGSYFPDDPGLAPSGVVYTQAEIDELTKLDEEVTGTDLAKRADGVGKTGQQSERKIL